MNCIVFIWTSVIFGGILCVKLPADFKKCHYGDVVCIANSMNDVIRRHHHGIPEIGLQSLDAILINGGVIIDPPRDQPLWMSFYFDKIVNYGFENITITRVVGFEKDPTLTKLEIYGQIPRIIHKGTYKSLGRVLLFHINATGDLESDFQNFRFGLKLKVFTEYRNNKRYLKIYELVSSVEVDRWIIWLDNLYNENSDLTILLNRVFNEHWVEFWNELEPGLLKLYTSLYRMILEKIFSVVAYDELFLQN